MIIQKYKIAEELMESIPELSGVLQNINRRKTNVIMGDKFILLAGEKDYIDYIGRFKYRISPASFFQVNTMQAKKLYNIIEKLCGYSSVIVDCYCGTGGISIYLAGKSKEVYGIEENTSAVNDARINAELNKLDNCNFICGNVEKELPLLKGKNINPDTVIFDPPRKGLKDIVVKTILKLEPEKIIYVSCNPATLARDLQKFIGKYEIKSIQPVDMFPRTYHIETVVLLYLK